MQREARTLSLAMRLILGTTLIIIGPAIVASLLHINNARQQSERIILDQMIERSEWGRDLLSVRLDRLWAQVKQIGKQINISDPTKLREHLTLTSDIDTRFSWIGYVDSTGRVLVSSNGMLEGANVAERPWFARGLEGPFAGDVHDAVLLQNLLPRRDEPYRFIDFAIPIKNTEGRTIGVLGAHMDWKWVKDTIGSFQSVDVEPLLLSKGGNILYGPANIVGTELRGRSAIAATAGASIARAEQWPDGETYLTVSLPIGTADDAPSFGWSIVMRRSTDSASAYLEALSYNFLAIVGIAISFSLLAIWALIYWNCAPIARAARFASLLADDSTVGVPPSPVGSSEAIDLANALSKMQSQLSRKMVAPFKQAG